MPIRESASGVKLSETWYYSHFNVSSDECKWLTPTQAKPPVMSEVSMSWWLSQAVQAELDSQICDERNRDSLSDLMTRLSQRLKSETMSQSK